MRYWLTAVMFSLGIAAILCAADLCPSIHMQTTPPSAGEKAFASHCASCHSETGPASVITPQSKTADEWNAWYDAGKHLGQDLTGLAPEENIRLIRGYCVENAAVERPEPDSSESSS
ncbi:MAG TPA: cytochrome c [bacterium]|nr:cytochrome c [bacterium]